MSDFQIAGYGTIIAITPITDAARTWLDDNVACEPWQWLGGALCIEPRCALDLIAAIAAEGFEIFP